MPFSSERVRDTRATVAQIDTHLANAKQRALARTQTPARQRMVIVEDDVRACKSTAALANWIRDSLAYVCLFCYVFF